MRTLPFVLACLLALAGCGHRPGPAGMVLYREDARGVAYLLADHAAPSTRGWAAFGGAAEAGETPAETAARETEEETRGYLKRAELLRRLGDQRPARDGRFRLYFLEVKDLDPAILGAIPVRNQPPAFRERGPYAWVPAEVVLAAVRSGAEEASSLRIPKKFLPEDRRSDEFWPKWIHNLRAADRLRPLPGSTAVRNPTEKPARPARR